MMNRQAMVIGALLLKTPSTCLLFSTPAASSTPTAAMTATSGFVHSRTKHGGMNGRVLELSRGVYAFKRLDIPKLIPAGSIGRDSA
jgi:hypothetical protein